MMAPFFPLYFWCSSPCNPKIFTFFPQLTTNKAKSSELGSILRTHYLQEFLLGLSWAHIWEATCFVCHVVITSSVRFSKCPVPIFCWNPPWELSDFPWTALRTSSFPATRTVTWNANSKLRRYVESCFLFVISEVSGVKFHNFLKPTLCLLSAKKFYKASWVCPMFKVSRPYMSLHDMKAVHEIKSQTHPCSGPLPLWRL